MKKKQETIAKINKSKSWFFEKINEMKKLQPDSSRKNWRRIKSTKLEMKMEKSQQTTQRLIRDYHQQLYGNKKDNLEDMDEFLEKYNLPKLNQEEIENLNRPITSMEIKAVIKNLSINKAWDQMASQLNSTKNLEKS